MDGIGISSKIATPLAGSDCGAEVVVMMLMQGVKGLCVGVSNEVIQVLGLRQAGVLRTCGGVVV